MISNENRYLGRAYECLTNLSEDELKRLEYEAREKAIRDYNHQMRTNWEDGHEEGMKEGIKEGMKEGIKEGMKEGIKEGMQLAKNVFRLSIDGKTMDEIAKELQISVEQVKEILE